MRSKLNNQDEVPRCRCLWQSATADTMTRLCTIAQVNEESFELAYSSNLMLAKCGKFRNHSYSLQAFCTWSPELTHCPEPEKFCQGTCSMIFCFLLNGVLQLYRSCMVILLYTVTVWPYAISFDHNLCSKFPLNMTIVGRRRCKARRTCSACATGVTSNVSNTWHLGEFIPPRQPGLQSLRSTASDTIYWHMMIFILHFATCSVLPSGERTLGLTSHRRSTVCFCAWWQGLQRCHSTSLEDSLQKNKLQENANCKLSVFFHFLFSVVHQGNDNHDNWTGDFCPNHWTTVPSLQLWGTPFTEEFTRATASERSITWRKLSGRIRWISSFFFAAFSINSPQVSEGQSWF